MPAGVLAIRPPGRRSGPSGFTAAGILLLLLVLALVGGSFGGLLFHAGELPVGAVLERPYTWSIIRFTLWQAGLSTLLSVGLAIPLARALHRRRGFYGRRLLIRLTSVSLVVPTMVAILGMVAVHGRNGWVNDLLAFAGHARQDYLYGLAGILMTHVFFNLPLATRLMLNGLAEIPSSQWKLAALYGFRDRDVFRLVEWPVLRGVIPGAAGVIFLLCFTSFAIVLSLGGGPAASTLEVAIYQALRFEFDLPKAAALSLIQVLLCGILTVLFFSFRGAPAWGAADAAVMEADRHRPDTGGLGGCLADAAVITLAAVYLLTPFIAVALGTLDGRGWSIVTDGRFWHALGWSVLISLAAGFIATASGFCMAWLCAGLDRSPGWRPLRALPELVGALTLIIPPLTLGAGLFLLLRQYTDALSLGHFMVIAVNALFTLAFTLRVLVGPVTRQRRRFENLGRSLGMSGLALWRLVYWPVLKRPICYALALATTLAAGDMGVIALFGTERLSTLPLLVYRLLGGYRLEQAAVAALCLCALCLLLFWLLEQLARLGRGEARDA